MDKIDGYEIQKTILFETGYGFALGCVPGMPEKSAVWNFTQTACGRDYYRKSCHASRDGAQEDFRRRERDYRMLYGRREKTGHSTVASIPSWDRRAFTAIIPPSAQWTSQPTRSQRGTAPL